MEPDFRKIARQWRSSNKARAAKLGLAIELPSIDEVEAHLRCQPLRCTYCNRPLNASKAGRMNLDHKLPISRGGTAAVHNIALSCRGCNSSKGPLDDSEFRSLLSFLSTWHDQGAAESLLSRLRGAFWCYRPAKNDPNTPEKVSLCHQHRVPDCQWCRATGGDGYEKRP